MRVLVLIGTAQNLYIIYHIPFHDEVFYTSLKRKLHLLMTSYCLLHVNISSPVE